MLQNVFYLGLTKYKDQTYPGQHETIIEQELFDKCQAVRARRRTKPRALGQKKRVYVLSGIARCHICGLTLRCQATKSGEQWRYYRHTAGDRGYECDVPDKMIRADKLEDQWSEIVSRIKLPAEWQQRVEELAGNAEERAAIIRAREAVQEKLRRLANLYRDLLIDEDEYRESLDKLQNQLSTLIVPDKQKVIQAGNYLESVRPLWVAATLTEKREITRILLKVVYVDVETGTIQGFQPHDAFKIIMEIVGTDYNVAD